MQLKILKFYAPWCGPCKLQSEYLNKVTGVSVTDINIEEDENSELVTMYKVRSVPKMILLDNEGEVLREFRTLTKTEDIQEIVNFYNNGI